MGKPRPVLIVQNDAYLALSSVTIVPLTSHVTEPRVVRPQVMPSPENGLNEVSQVMADKITTIPRTRLRDRVGQLDEADVMRVETAMLIFLGFGRR